MARRIFDSLNASLNAKTVVLWSLIINRYIINDGSSKHSTLFYEIENYGGRVDTIMLTNILPACVNIRAL